MSGLLERVRAAAKAVTWGSARPEPLPALADDGFPRQTLRRFVERKGGERPLVVVNDSARVIHCGLPQLLHELRGWAPKLRVLVATGTHKGDLEREVARLGGPVELHDCDDAAAHASIGGFNVDRRLLDASSVIAFGSVEPHYFAGWTGAHKTLGVGLWDRATITRNHEQATQLAAQPMNCSDQNPVAAGIRVGVRAFLAKRPGTLAVNHVLDPAGVPLAAGWGEPFEALSDVLPAASSRCAHKVDAPQDVVVAHVEGPLGRSLYQADKGVKNHEAVVKNGGLLVLLASLDEGLGPDRFVRFLEQASTLDAARAHLASKGYTLGDHKALRWRALEARGVRIVVVSEHLDPEALQAAHVRVVPTLADALAGASGAGLAVEDAGFVASRLRVGS